MPYMKPDCRQFYYETTCKNVINKTCLQEGIRKKCLWCLISLFPLQDVLWDDTVNKKGSLQNFTGGIWQYLPARFILFFHCLGTCAHVPALSATLVRIYAKKQTCRLKRNFKQVRMSEQTFHMSLNVKISYSKPNLI